MSTFKSNYVQEILQIDNYRQEIATFNAIFSGVESLFRTKLPLKGGNYTLLEIAREYITIMSKMVWRLSALIFEVAKAQAPELVVFKQNVVTLLNNVNKTDSKIREISLVESLWKRKYRPLASDDSPPTDYEYYWSNVVKSTLDKIYSQTNNLIHTAISLGSIYKVRLAIFDKTVQQPQYEPRLVPSELQALKNITKNPDQQ